MMNVQNVTPILRSLKFAVGFECNLKCGFCLKQNHNRKLILSFEHVEKILNEDMVKSDLRLVTLTGGEPTIEPYLQLSLQIIRLAHSMGKETCIFTNGTLLDDEKLKLFREAGLTRFRISLYDPIDWGKIEKLMDKVKTFGFPAMLKYTVTKENFRNLEEVLKKIPEIGTEWFQVKPYNRIEVPEVDSVYEMFPEQVLAMAKMLVAFRRNNTGIKMDLLPLCYEFLVDENLSLEELSPCNCGKGPRGYLDIDPDGEIRVCGAYPVSIGNIGKNSITDIWINHPLLRLVRNLANRQKPKECEGCKHWEKCAKTDCHSATFARYGNFDHGNPQCPLLHKNS